MKKEMLINVLQPESAGSRSLKTECSRSCTSERTSHESYTGNIYKGKIVNLGPAIQAAFVDFSVGRNGFLHVRTWNPDVLAATLMTTPRTALAKRVESLVAIVIATSHVRRASSTRDGATRPPPPTEDRYRERPDRSEKGRRDRSRRFGEGLVDDWDLPPPPPSSLTLPDSPIVEGSRLRRLRLGKKFEPFSWSTSRGEVTTPRIDEPEAASCVRDVEPASIDPVEAELPPSRTSNASGRPQIAAAFR